MKGLCCRSRRPIHSSLPAAIFLLFAAGCSSRITEETLEKPDRLQIFVSVEEEPSAAARLVMVGLDAPHRETPVHEQAISPACAPDGSSMLFVDASSRVLYQIDFDTGHVRRPLGDFAYPCFLPAWSPDGTQIAFAAEPETGNREIYLHDIDRNETVRLTRHEKQDSYPSWGARGKRICFTSDRRDNPHLYTMRTDGSDVRPLIRYAPHEWTGVACSPDGNSLVFTAVAAGGDHHLLLAPTDGSPLSQLTRGGAINRHPAWSPGGRFLAYVRYRNRQEQIPKERGDLVVYDALKRTHTVLLKERVITRTGATLAWRSEDTSAAAGGFANRTANRSRHRRVFTVINTKDRGEGSLRWAIEQANHRLGPDTIEFNIPASDPGFIDVDAHLPDGNDDPDVFRIRIRSHLPILDDELTIDGRSQSSFTGDTNHLGPEIVIDGSLASADGLIIASSNNHVRGLNIQGCNHNGIRIRGKKNWIEGNHIGTDATGIDAAPNNRASKRWAGIWLAAEAKENIIGTNADGTADEEERNVFSGNLGHGVAIAGGSENLIAGNYIGVDAGGSTGLGNSGIGVLILGGSDNTVGGEHAAAGNIIGSNQGHGVSIAQENASGNRILGNQIGTDRSGTVDLGHGFQGVNIERGAHDNRVGGFAKGAGNTIAFSSANGVVIRQKAANNFVLGNLIVDNHHTGATIIQGSTGNFLQGNLIGIDASGTEPRGNGTSGVRISDSTGNTIGGTTPRARNVISANGLRSDDNFACGVMLDSGENVVQGNFIGTDLTGTASLGNATHGVVLRGSTGNLIGGSSRGAGNLISGNGGHGILLYNASSGTVVAGNRIGTDALGHRPLGNGRRGIAIMGGSHGNRFGLPGSSNTIAYNAGRDGFSIISARTGGMTRVTGIVNISPNAQLTLDFYAESTPAVPGFSNAQRYLGSSAAASGGNGIARIDVTLSAMMSPMEKISVTATDSNDNRFEFSFDPSPADAR